MDFEIMGNLFITELSLDATYFTVCCCVQGQRLERILESGQVDSEFKLIPKTRPVSKAPIISVAIE